MKQCGDGGRHRGFVLQSHDAVAACFHIYITHPELPVMLTPDAETIIAHVVRSEVFKAEAACLARGGTVVHPRVRLLKHLENELVRLIFPTNVREVDDGTPMGLVCLYDKRQATNIYAHAIFAGPTVNTALRSLYNPPTQAKPQPGDAGNRAILKFTAWKQAAWEKFLVDELEQGTAPASETWISSFWRALDRMYGGGNLIEPEAGPRRS